MNAAEATPGNDPLSPGTRRAIDALRDERPVPPPHPCPGGCGTSVPHNKLACFDCWFLLPDEQRGAIRQARGHRRRELIGEAVGWYREHVREGRLINQPASKVRYTLDESWRPRGA